MELFPNPAFAPFLLFLNGTFDRTRLFGGSKSYQALRLKYLDLGSVIFFSFKKIGDHGDPPNL